MGYGHDSARPCFQKLQRSGKSRETPALARASASPASIAEIKGKVSELYRQGPFFAGIEDGQRSSCHLDFVPFLMVEDGLADLTASKRIILPIAEA
jgi:hypothetical protein